MSIGIEDRAKVIFNLKVDGRKITSSSAALLIEEVNILNSIQVYTYIYIIFFFRN